MPRKRKQRPLPQRRMLLAAAAIVIIAAILIIETGRPGALAPPGATAPELAGIVNWVNTGPLTLEELRGNVVLVDFWTYSCINCIRTLPYLVAWDNAYRDDGLVIVGVHTPEFTFEKVLYNVQAAVERYGIQYPVGLDNNYQTWRAFGNNYWPRKYLIDVSGSIRYDHIGEGGYAETEAVIRQLLRERNGIEPTGSAGAVSAEQPGLVGTPELYFGQSFIRKPFGNSEQPTLRTDTTYAVPEELEPNTIYLEGQWRSWEDNQESRSPGRILLRYTAAKANLVLGANNPVAITVLVDGQSAAGSDLVAGSVLVGEERLYNLASAATAGEHVLEIRVSDAGLRAYAFTFG